MNKFIKKFEELFENYKDTVFYHGTADNNLDGKNGIHIGSYLAAKQALEARIGVPAEGEWDGTKEYGKTLLAGKNTLRKFENSGIFCETGFNCGKDVPVDDYYPTKRERRATYSDRTQIPFDSKPIIFPVKITGSMSNSPYTPHEDFKANGLMKRSLTKGNARNGFYYTNIAEDSGSISAVVPNKTFLSY